ncbi:hypothetical protein AS9A_2549 [Hoyosella subflava DQS3-9A1]|uniref:Flavodoxin-like domain-containing protein n=2 Tax=Hoyosella TaxID=697025 RepID=F6EGE3_HOYSD|nr:hypothetical protein AS9A_2549 [Hoyosella subflava DQS3-9A1]
MRTVIVYESMFGNTRAIAEAIGEGVAEHSDVTVLNLDDITEGALADVDLVVAGGPTHTFGMSRPQTRLDAANRQPYLVTQRVSLRDWLPTLADREAVVDVAVFCTKAAAPRWLPGSAAHSAARALKHRHIGLAAKPVVFHVEGMQGPLVPGELDRARDWGAELAHATKDLKRRRR